MSQYDDLRGDDLDAAVRDAGDPDTTTGGSNQDGSWSATEKRDYLRGQNGDDDSSLSDADLAAAQSLPLTQQEKDALKDAHARNDVDDIGILTDDINDRRAREYAASR